MASRKYRSKFEERVSSMLSGIDFEYEPMSLPYVLECKYTPDFVLANGIILECKGYHPDIKNALRKLRAVKDRHPELDIRILWEADIKLGKIMRASDWSERYNFPYAIKELPEEWLRENTKNV